MAEALSCGDGGVSHGCCSEENTQVLDGASQTFCLNLSRWDTRKLIFIPKPSVDQCKNMWCMMNNKNRKIQIKKVIVNKKKTLPDNPDVHSDAVSPGSRAWPAPSHAHSSASEPAAPTVTRNTVFMASFHPIFPTHCLVICLLVALTN